MKKLVLIFSLALNLAGCGNPPQAPSDNPVVLRIVKADGTPSEFQLTRINYDSLARTELKGKVAVVDFWATWCQPCIVEIPNYNALKEKFAGEDVEILGVTVESGSNEDIKPKVEEFKMKYQVVAGDDKVVEDFGGVIGFPTTFLVARDGSIYKKYLGSPENKMEQIEKDIHVLLLGDPE